MSYIATFIFCIALTALASMGWVTTNLQKIFPTKSADRLNALLMTAPYLLGASILAIRSTYVPDEANFIHLASAFLTDPLSVIDVLAAQNLEGFGGLFWGLLTLVMWMVNPSTSYWHDLSQTDSLDFRLYVLSSEHAAVLTTLIAFRILVILLLSVWFYTFSLRILKQNGFWRIAPSLALTFPMFWWAGKIESPELIATALIGIAVVCYLSEKPISATLLSGIAMGFKVSAAPVALCLLVVLLVKAISRSDGAKNRVKTIVSRVLTFSAGWLITNLFILINPLVFIQNGQRLNPVSQGKTSLQVFKSFWPAWEGSYKTTWDYVNVSGFLYWTGGVFACLLITCILLQQRRWLDFALISTALVGTTTILITSNATEFPWYYFPVIITGISMTVIPFKDSGNRALVPLRPIFSGAIIIFLILFTLTGTVTSSLNELSALDRYQIDQDLVTQESDCLSNEIGKLSPNQPIYDLGSIGYSALPPQKALDAWDATRWFADNSQSSAYFVLGTNSQAHLRNTFSRFNLNEIASCDSIKIVKVSK